MTHPFDTAAVRALAIAYVGASSLVAGAATLLVVGVFYVLIALCCHAAGLRPRVLAAAVTRCCLNLFTGHIERFGGLKLEVRGDPVTSERAVLVCNHRSWVDTIVLMSLARHSGMEGNLRFVADKQLLKLPVFGLIAAILDVVFLIERKAATSRAPLSRAYGRLRHYGRCGVPFWLIVYAEGYLRSAVKLAAGREFAESRGLTPLKHLLQPRTKGFVAAVTALRHELDCIYDVTIAYGDKPYDEVTPGGGELYVVPASKDRVVNVHTRRIPISEVPRDEDEAKEWLYKLYQEKDRRLEEFYTAGRFDAPRVQWERITRRRLLLYIVSSLAVSALCIAIVVLIVAKLRNPTERVLPSVIW